MYRIELGERETRNESVKMDRLSKKEIAFDRDRSRRVACQNLVSSPSRRIRRTRTRTRQTRRVGCRLACVLRLDGGSSGKLYIPSGPYRSGVPPQLRTKCTRNSIALGYRRPICECFAALSFRVERLFSQTNRILPRNAVSRVISESFFTNFRSNKPAAAVEEKKPNISALR